MEKLRSKVNQIFSDTLMIALALLIIPVILAQSFLNLSPSQQTLVSVVDWIIWIGFFLEFVLKLIVYEKRAKWLTDNWFDSIISVTVIISPILENLSTIFAAVPILRLVRLSRLIRLTRLTRLTRFLRFLRLLAMGGKIKSSWSKINLKVYAVFFFVLGIGFVTSFIATSFQHTLTDITWISVFVNVFGVFYAVLISFFIMHVWGKYNSISSEISQQINSLRNVYILSLQLPSHTQKNELKILIKEYVDELINSLWNTENQYAKLNKKFLLLTHHFNNTKFDVKADEIVFSHIMEELRISSVAQSNIINLISEKTPKILWIMLLSLSIILIGSFIFLGFENQLVATILITLISAITAFVVALIFDINTPLQAGFWNISPKLYEELKDFVDKN